MAKKRPTPPAKKTKPAAKAKAKPQPAASAAKAKAKPPAAAKKKPPARKKSAVVAFAGGTVDIVTINNGVPGSVNYARNQPLVAKGTSSETFGHVSGVIIEHANSANQYPHTNRAGVGTNWTLTWVANTVANAGLHHLVVSLDNDPAMDTANITFV